MTHRPRIAWCLIALLMFGQAALGADIGVLTPAYSGQLDADLDNAFFSQATMGLADALRNNDGRTRKFNELASSKAFDLVTAFNRALVDELAKTQHTAEAVPIVRRPRPRVAPLARDEVPEHTNTRMLLDVTLYYVGIYGAASSMLYEPAILMDYRWVDPSGGLVQSSRRIQYNPMFRAAEDRSKPEWNPFGGRSTENRVIVKTAQGCQFSHYSVVEEQAEKVFGCMDSALHEVAAIIAKNVPPLDSLGGGRGGGLSSSRQAP